MPLRDKLEDFDPNKSDPEDSDYDATAPRVRKVPKPARSKTARRRPRQRQGHDGSDDLDDSELEDEEAEDSYEEDTKDESEAEYDLTTGRPKRKVKQKGAVNYEESDGDSVDFMNALDEGPGQEPPRKKHKTNTAAKKELIVKLKQPSQSRRGSSTQKRPSTADLAYLATRRSSRIAHDDTEPILALTNSGNHVDVVRTGTRSPEGIPRRAMRGGKGLKTLPSAIIEVEDESSANTKLEERESQPSQEVDMVIAASGEDEGDDELGEAGASTAQHGGKTAEIEVVALEPDTVPESDEDAEADEDDDDEDIVRHARRPTRRSASHHEQRTQNDPSGQRRSLRPNVRSAAASQSRRKGRQEAGESSDFEPANDEVAEENLSDSDHSERSPRKASRGNDSNDSSNNPRRSTRRGRSQADVEEDDESDEDAEIAEEIRELQGSGRSRRAKRKLDSASDNVPQTRKRKPVDYRIIQPESMIPLDDDGPGFAVTPSRRGKGAGAQWQRSLFSTYGPFGGASGPPPVFGGAGEIAAAGGADSDSSDEESMRRPRGPTIGGVAGMTPTSAAPAGFGLFPPLPGHAVDPLQGHGGAPVNVGKLKDKQALTDADPLGVDQNVNFDGVGGLQGHIDQLKEMVALPLLYPEIFHQFHVTPPRGVLFHGPPGTGKTLMARALASSVSSNGKKVTFYMRKGADSLSKWVGEAEKGLRLLFEEARKTQPSIIFFDEIDGLAPVRSSKQDQIHSSIVSTLLALMDGMDGRGQVIVIGATNRPDSVDPALRRPGRFDREFYFPLPNTEARRVILDIHTKGWEPPLGDALKTQLAELTRGYGGADLRALCTEAALNAVQRRYPQIYASNEKLQIDTRSITIAPKDFMISIKKMVPSSERSIPSGASPLPPAVEPLLRRAFNNVKQLLSEILPLRKARTALEEAQYEDAEDDGAMDTERMQQEFERSRVFRPRLLLRGLPGMGQQYLAGALLNHFEGLHVQAFDLPNLLSDTIKTMEATTIQFFTEVRRHKPSVIYIPNVDIWYKTLGESGILTFVAMLRSLAPTDPVLLLGVLEGDEDSVDSMMIRQLFGFSKKNQFEIEQPCKASRHEFFHPIVDYLNTSPSDFPNPADRKKRQFEELLVAPPEPPKAPVPPTKEELRAQKRRDRQVLNQLKVRIQPILDQIKNRYKKFRTGVVEESQIRYLYQDSDPPVQSADDLLEQQSAFRPYEKGTDDHGQPGLVEQSTKRFFYNMEIVTIEQRLSNGYYKRPKDFLADIKKITKDAKTIGDAERLLKANELQANVEVDIVAMDYEVPALVTECEAVYLREVEREKEMIAKARQKAAIKGRPPEPVVSNVPPYDPEASTEPSSGPILLGQPLPNGFFRRPITPQRSLSSTHTNGVTKEISDLSDIHEQRNSNPASVPLHDDDVQMTNSEPPSQAVTQQSSFGPSAQTRPLHFHTGAPASLQQRISYPGSLSQKSAITPLAEGSHPRMYENSASTTSSDKKLTGSSGPFNTQSTLNRVEGPDLSILPRATSATSQLPNTQTETLPSQPSVNNSLHSQASQGHPTPNTGRPNPSAIHTFLNDSPIEISPPATLHPSLKTDRARSLLFLEHMVSETHRCSVEQLEQVYSALMSEIWRTRGEWDRVKVLHVVQEALAAVLDDIAACQEMGVGSRRH